MATGLPSPNGPLPVAAKTSTPPNENTSLAGPTGAPLAPVAGQAGREGVHTEALGYVLAELQSVARAYPDATW